MGEKYFLYRNEHDCSRYLFCSTDFLTAVVHTTQYFLLWGELWQQNLLSSFGRRCWRSSSDSWLTIWEGTIWCEVSILGSALAEQGVYFSFGTELHQQLKLRNWTGNGGSWGAFYLLSFLSLTVSSSLLVAALPGTLKWWIKCWTSFPQDSEPAFSCWGHQGVKTLCDCRLHNCLCVLTNAIRKKFLHS